MGELTLHTVGASSVLQLLYEDEDVLVINKPPGYASQQVGCFHGTCGLLITAPQGSKLASHRAVDWLAQGLATPEEPIRLVHRLDKVRALVAMTRW